MLIVQKFPLGPLGTNAILFGCSATGKGAVIDPSRGATSPILQEALLESLTIQMILLTHSHWDHIADVFPLREKTGAPVYIHSLDEGNLADPGSDGIPLYFPIRSVEPDRLLKEGKVIKLGDLTIEVIHTPGHSPGGVCFYLREQKVLFSGDTLFKGTMGGLHLPTSQPELMESSLAKLAALPADTRVIPGHGEETTIGAENWLKRS
jgi:glyoxylase-like metal-dependent hydrolase (beta-lactamase superfamily II)